MPRSHSKPKKQPTTQTKPTKPPKEQTIGWIWPKDPRPGNPSRWPRLWRFSDVLTGKGPDIYVGAIGKRPPPTKDRETPGRTVSSTNWARWDVEPEEDDTPVRWARRDKREKYDYSTRKYGIPNERTWSAVEYADCEWEGGKWPRKKVAPKTPIRYWDRYGKVHWCNGQDPEGCYDEGVDVGSCKGGSHGHGRSHGYCHCHCGLHERDSGLGSHEHVHEHPYLVRSHCPGCCCELRAKA